MHADMNIAPTVISRPLKDRLGSYVAALRDYRRERRDLILLSEMDDHRLRDIGVTRDEVVRARARPFRHLVD